MSEFTPTDEQAVALGHFLARTPLVVEAGAGTGKTSTLRLMADTDTRRGTYVAFNRAIVNEAAAKMPERVRCATAHSLAFRAKGRAYADRLNASRRMRSAEVARALRITDPLKVTMGQAAKFLAPGFLAGHAMRAIANFCNSADPEPTRRHVPKIEGIDPADQGYGPNNRMVAEALEPALARAWADLASHTGQLRFTHDCQPPGTLVRRLVSGMPTRWEDVPIEDVREGDMVVSFTMTQRRGFVRRAGRRVNAVGGRQFNGNLVRIHTERGRTTAVTPSHVCVARLDTPLDAGNHVVYMARRGDQYRIGRTTWRTGSQGNTLGIMRRADSQGADAMWVLSVHATDADAALAEAITAYDYGVPTWTFSGPREVMPRGSFWRHVGPNHAAAQACLHAHGRMVAYPLWEHDGGVRNYRRPVKIRACNLLDGMRMCEPDEMTPGAHDGLVANEGSKAWAQITLTAERYNGPVYNLDVDTDHTYVADGIVTGNCYLKLWQLGGARIDGDYVLFDEAQDASPVMLDIVAQQADHAQLVYVGDTQQQIYGWRGAINALASLDGAERTLLTQSFRFGPAIAEVANEVLDQLGADLRLVGSPWLESRIDPDLADPAAILCRTNATTVRLLLAEQKNGGRPHLVGDGKEVVAFARAVIELQAKGWTPHPELTCFGRWGEVQDYVDQDPSGGELRLLVKLVEEYTAETIIEALGKPVPEADATVVLSTAHKAKGREWATVRLADDYPEPSQGEELADEELRLVYVAATRAMEALDPSGVAVLAGPPDEPALLTCADCGHASHTGGACEGTWDAAADRWADCRCTW